MKSCVFLEAVPSLKLAGYHNSDPGWAQVIGETSAVG
jgi:hypothetical protein